MLRGCGDQQELLVIRTNTAVPEMIPSQVVELLENGVNIII